ncbi:nucleotidyltransferase family protein [Frateuria aurantia]
MITPIRTQAAYRRRLVALLCQDGLRHAALQAVHQLHLPDAWIGAGFVRDAVWDALHGRGPQAPVGDVDVVWFSLTDCDPALDRQLEQALHQQLPMLDWSVKNQARMHLRNGDAPYASVSEAMARWPQTATAVAARLDDHRHLEIDAPYGLADLFELKLRPTPLFASRRYPIFQQRVADKIWLQRYPLLRLEQAHEASLAHE